MDYCKIESNMNLTEDRQKYDREYQQRRCAEDPEYHEARKRRSREWKARHTAKINALVAEGKNRPCVDCGRQLHPCCMEYDHVRGEKKFGLAKAARIGCSVTEVREEIAKCEVRCVVCHRMKHLA